MTADFAVPVALAALAARVVARLVAWRRFRNLGRFAAAAAIGLLGVTVLALARPVVGVHPVLLVGSLGVMIAAIRGISPIVLLAACAAGGGVIGSL